MFFFELSLKNAGIGEKSTITQQYYSFFLKTRYAFTTSMSYVRVRKIPNYSICTEWKFEGCLNFERNNTHQEKTTLLCWNTNTLLGLALKVNKRVLTFCFGKFWNRNQSVAMWLVSRQQFHSLLQGNDMFFCFCKCCL